MICIQKKTLVYALFAVSIAYVLSVAATAFEIAVMLGIAFGLPAITMVLTAVCSKVSTLYKWRVW
jgi:hypothetical protein